MAVNTEMFRKIYDQISLHPETHDQDTYEGQSGPHCGTQRCIAGWAVAFEYGVESGSIYQNEGIWDWHSEGRETETGLYMSRMAVQAAKILGLTDEQAARLFLHTSNEEAVAECLRYAMKGDEA